MSLKEVINSITSNRLGLVWKIVGAIALLFAVFILLMGIWISTMTRDLLLDKEKKTAIALSSSVDAILQNEWDMFANSILLTTFKQLLMESIPRGRVDSTQTYLVKEAAGVNADIIDVFDKEGRFFASSRETTELTEPPALKTLIRSLIEGGKNSTFLLELSREEHGFHGINLERYPHTPDEGSLLTVAVFGVLKDDWGDIQGYLLALRILNNDMDLAKYLSDAIGADISLFQGNTRIATTLTGAEKLDLGTMSVRKDLGENVAISEILKTPYMIRYQSLFGRNGESLGGVAVDLPIGDTMLNVTSVRLRVVLAGTAALLLFCTILILLVRLSLNPVKNILIQMDRIAQGHLDADLYVQGQDEIGKIASAINSTSSQLRSLIGDAKKATFRNRDATAVLEKAHIDLAEASTGVGDAVTTINSSSTEMMKITELVASEMDQLNTAAKDNLVSLRELATSVDGITSGAGELATESVQTLTSLSEMSSGMSQVSANVTELTGLLDNSASATLQLETSVQEVRNMTERNMKLASDLSSLASDKGQTAMTGARGGMDKITALMSALNETSSKLNKRSREVESITQIITEISEQTNLLSLNALILAAQAADEGKGFAVVAKEIRDLAERTDDSTKSIAQLVTNIQNDTKESLKQTEEGIGIVASGVEDVKHMELILGQIIEGSNESRELAQNIASQTDSQAKAHKQITRNIQNIATRATEIAATIMEQDSSSNQIKIIAETLQERSQIMRSATSEQSDTLRMLTGETERSVEVSEKVTDLSGQAALGAEELNRLAGIITDLTKRNNMTLTSLKTAVEDIASQSSNIIEKMEMFHVED